MVASQGGQTEVHFSGWKDRLIELIKEHDIIIGTVANLEKKCSFLKMNKEYLCVTLRCGTPLTILPPSSFTRITQQFFTCMRRKNSSNKQLPFHVSTVVSYIMSDAAFPNEIVIAILRRRAIDETLPMMYTTEENIKKALQDSLSSAALISKQWQACAQYVYHRLFRHFSTILRQKRLTDFLENHLRTIKTYRDQTFVVFGSDQFYREYSIWPLGPMWSVHRYTEKEDWSLYSHNGSTYHTLDEMRDILVPPE